MTLTPVLDRDEYVEQAYFFGAFRDRLQENLASQQILAQLHEEILTTTRLPLAIQFLATEIKHSGLLASGFARLPHYFTPFQALVVRQAETEGLKFAIDTALTILEGEARYRAEGATPAGLFVYEFEVLCRHRLGYDDGLEAMAGDAFFDDEWRGFFEMVRRSVGEVEFADLLFVRSELANQERLRDDPTLELPRPLFGAKEGKIAKASHGRDPLFLFSALQRQLKYPMVPKPSTREEPLKLIPQIMLRLEELEQKHRLLDGEVRGKMDAVLALGKPEDVPAIDLD